MNREHRRKLKRASEKTCQVLVRGTLAQAHIAKLGTDELGIELGISPTDFEAFLRSPPIPITLRDYQLVELCRDIASSVYIARESGFADVLLECWASIARTRQVSASELSHVVSGLHKLGFLEGPYIARVWPALDESDIQLN